MLGDRQKGGEFVDCQFIHECVIIIILKIIDYAGGGFG